MKKLQLIILLFLLSFATHAQVTANFMASDTLGCLPDFNVQFTSTSTSVQPIASYSWDIGGINIGTNENTSYTFTLTGVYNVCLTVTDIFGEIDTYCENVLAIETPVVTLTSTPTPLSCNNTSVVLEANPSFPNTTNTWYDSNGNVISNNTGVFVSNAGTYTFEIIDNLSGCSSSSTIDVVAVNGYPVAAIQNPSILSCSNPIVTLDGTGSSPSPDFTYEWKIGNVVISTDVTVDVSYAGLYTLEVTNVAMPWCSSTAQVNVMNDGSGPILNLPTTPFNDTIYNCQEVIHLSEDLVDASCVDCTVEVTNANDDLICNSLPCVAGGAWPLPLKITVTDNTTGCFTSTILETPHPGAASFSYNTTDESCAGGDGAIDVINFNGTSGPYTIDWFDLPGTNDPLDRTDLSAGTYTLLITNIVGCPLFGDSLGMDFEIESIAVIADASATITNQVLTCSIPTIPFPITLDASNSSMGPNVIYEWFDDNNNLVGTGITIEVNDIGEYTLVVTDTVTQCSDTDEVIFNITQSIDLPIANAGSSQTLTCNTPSVTLDGSGSSMGMDYTYTWIDNIGNVISNTITVDVNQTGTYTLMVTDILNGCTATSSVEVLEDTSPPNISLQNTISCSGEVNIANNICAGCTIEIFDSTGVLVCDMLPCSFFPNGGNYTVVVTSSTGCQNTELVNIAVPVSLEFDAVITDATCNGGIDGSIELNVLGGNPPYNYLWSTGNTTEDIFGLTSDTYTVTVTDGNGCQKEETYTILEAANLGLIITNDTTICTGETVDLDVSWIPTVVLPVEWTPATGLSDPNITNPTATPTETTLYTVVVTESTGCTAEAQVIITVDDCVWPGDTDTNKVVNNFDLLNIGLAFDTIGFARPNASLSWVGQLAPDWFQVTPTTNVNYKHINTDGNGIINSDDTLAIVQNWGLTHDFTGTTIYNQFTDLPPVSDGSVVNAPFYVEPDSLPEGETIGLDIILGDMSNMISGLYGIAFSIEYDPTMIVPGSASIDFSNCWLGDVNANAISIQKDFSTPGRIDVAITRIDGIEMDGAGFFGTFIITLEDDILLWDPNRDETDNDVFADFTITNYHLINFAQEEIMVEGMTTSAPVKGDGTTSIHNAYLEKQIQLYPNPANELFFISSAKNVYIEQVKIYSTTKLIKAIETKTIDVIEIPTMDLPSGIYFIELQTEKGVVTKKVNIVR